LLSSESSLQERIQFLGSLYRLASVWEFESLAKDQLRSLELHVPLSAPALRLLCAHQFDISDWARPALRALISRSTPLTSAELSVLGQFGSAWIEALDAVRAEFAAHAHSEARAGRSLCLQDACWNGKNPDFIESRIRHTLLLPRVDRELDDFALELEHDIMREQQYENDLDAITSIALQMRIQ
jgi:hypothetical protein